MLTFKRNFWPGGKRGGTWNEQFTERKRDLLGWRGPLQLDVAVLQAKAGEAARRTSWSTGAQPVADADYRTMTPADWGWAAIPDGASPIDSFTIDNALFTSDATVQVKSAMAADVAIQRYLISETRETPTAADPRWSTTSPSKYTIVGKEGDVTLTLWAETADGAIWSSLPATTYYATAKPDMTAAPVLTSDLTDTGWVRWQTTVDCFAYVAYRAVGETAWRTTPMETAHGKTHRHQLIGLVPGKQYEVEIHNGSVIAPVISYTHLANYRADTAPEIPLAGLTATASSKWGSDSDASNALTGTGYGWRNNQSSTSWWQVDLGKRCTISKLTYQGRTNDAMIKEYNIYVSDSLSDWGTPVANGQFTIRNEPQEIPILTPKSGRYLRVEGVSRNIIPGYVGILRLRVFGTPVE
jgi:hypothetical protein